MKLDAKLSWIVAGVLWGLLTPIPGLAQQNVNRGWDEGKPFYVEFDAGVHDESLPFDVPFPLRTKPPEGRDVGSLDQAILVPGKDDATEACQPGWTGTVKKDDMCGKFPSSACSLDFRGVKTKKEGEAQAVSRIQLEVPMLEADQYYCFLLKYPPTSADRAALLDRIRDTVVEFRHSRSLNMAEATQLCGRLEASILRLVDDDPTLRITKDPGFCYEAIRAYQEDAFQQVAVSNLKVEIESNQSKISGALSADETTSLEGPPTGLRELDSEQLQRWLAAAGVEGGGDKLLPTTGSEAVARLEVLEARLSELAGHRVDCGDDTLAAPGQGLIRKISSELLGACISMHSLVEELRTQVTATESQINKLVAAIRRWITLTAGTHAGFKNRFNRYVSADEGFAHAWDLDQTFSYTGVNVYGRPVNKAAPLRLFSPKERFWRRAALMIGVPNSIDDDPAWDGLIGDKPVIIGAGYRFTDYLRFTLGAVVLEEQSPNPLVDESEGLKVSPFVSLSLDIDVVSIFTNLLGSGGSGDPATN